MILLLIYFSILFTGVVLYTTLKKSANKKALYSKFLSFALVATFTYSIFNYYPTYSYVLYITISAIALYEIITVTKHLKLNYIYISSTILLLIVFCYTAFIPTFPMSNLFLCVVAFDAFSQFFGQLFGKHFLLKTISPNKTIEGCIGGLCICILTSALTFNSITLGILIACFALCGDLLASFVKRKSNVKDFSNLLPAQGGILDRFDSYIVTSIFILLLMSC